MMPRDCGALTSFARSVVCVVCDENIEFTPSWDAGDKWKITNNYNLMVI